MTTLSNVFDACERGEFPPQDGLTEVLARPAGATGAVIAFTNHTYVAADLDIDWVQQRIDITDPASSVRPEFLVELAARLDAMPDTFDALLLGTPLDEPVPHDVLPVPAGFQHPRLTRARLYRNDVSAYMTTDGDGILVFGRGLAGRLEAAIEVLPGSRGKGTGSKLALAARVLAPNNSPVFVQIAPGNAASLRMVLRGGFVPIGAEMMFI